MPRQTTIQLQTIKYRELVEQYHTYLLQMGYEKRTSKSRYYRLREFMSWLEQKGIHDIQHISSKNIQSYRQYLENRTNKNQGGKLQQKTIHGHLQVIKSLFVMQQQQGNIQASPYDVLDFIYPKRRNRRTVLTQAEIQLLYEHSINHQQRAILSLAYGCGLRAKELERLNREDILLQEKVVVVQQGKGNKKRIIPISGNIAKDLANYYNESYPILAAGRKYNTKNKAFMLNSLGGRMCHYTYNKELKKIIDQTENQVIKDKQITLHHLRHSIATHLLERGMQVHEVRQFLGHRHLETTQLYTHITLQQIKNMKTSTKPHEG